MYRHWMFTAFCIVAVAWVCQEVEGANQCLMRCKLRCRTLQNQRRTTYWTCVRKCSRMARTCESCIGPNKCLKCMSGYKHSIGPYCVADIKTCSTNNGGCSAQAKCTGSPGSVNCTCNPGFVGNGKTCNDIDECASDYGNCSTEAICTNSAGSFSCSCRDGYSGNGFYCTGWTLTNKNSITFKANTHESAEFNPQQRFILLPCLAPNVIETTPQDRCVSLMPEFLQGYYVRSYDNDLMYSRKDNEDATFDKYASFIIVKDQFYPGYVAFKSVGDPSKFIVAYNDEGTFRVIIGTYEETDFFVNHASFKMNPAS